VQNSHAFPPGPKLNLGCGHVQPEGWVNIDGSTRAWFASKLAWLDHLLVRLHVFRPTHFDRRTKHCDLRKGIPYAGGAVSCIYAGELWEHFEYEVAGRLTRECHRVLGPGGVLRVCVPDGVEFWRRYLQIHDEIMAKPREARDAAPLRDHVNLYFDDICTRKLRLSYMGYAHKWQFDEVQLVELLESNGFTEVERMPFHESRVPDIANVERSDFLIVEGVKRG